MVEMPRLLVDKRMESFRFIVMVVPLQRGTRNTATSRHLRRLLLSILEIIKSEPSRY
jgi:hypothetical protein